MDADLHQKLAICMPDIAATFLGFTHDVEASDLALGEDLERSFIRTKVAHKRLGMHEYMEWEHGTVWGAIRSSV